MSKIREWLNAVEEHTGNWLVSDGNHDIYLLTHEPWEPKWWIQVNPCGTQTGNDKKLYGNGAVFAYREALRMAKKLHMVTKEYDIERRSFCVRITTNKDVKRLEELWKYLTGKTFNKRILNNGWWR